MGLLFSCEPSVRPVQIVRSLGDLSSKNVRLLLLNGGHGPKLILSDRSLFWVPIWQSKFPLVANQGQVRTELTRNCNEGKADDG